MEDKAINLVIEKLSEICNRQEPGKNHRSAGADGTRHAIGASDETETISEPESNPSVVIEMETNQQCVYYCSECGYSSHNKYYLKQHVDLVHNARRPYKCPFCDYAGKRSYALKEHLIVHSSDRPHQCPHCFATFRKKGHLTNHVKMHQNQLTCSICKVTCKGKQALLSHLQQQHSTDDQQVFACDQCLYACNDNDVMMRHIQEHMEPKRVVMLKCSECGFTCSTTAIMENHMVAVHLKEVDESVDIPVPVPVSATAPATKASPVPTKVNIESVAEYIPEIDTESLYSCGVCGFSTNDEPRMTDHMASHVLRKTPSKVNENKEYRADSSGHFTYNPTSKTFACSICGYTCDQQRTIKSHIWKHSGHKDILYPKFMLKKKCDEKVNVKITKNQCQNRQENLLIGPDYTNDQGGECDVTQPLTEVCISSSGNADDVRSVEMDNDSHKSPPVDIAKQAAEIAQIVSAPSHPLMAVAPPIDVVVGAQSIRKRRASDSVLDAKRLRMSDTLESVTRIATLKPIAPLKTGVSVVNELPPSGEKVLVIQNEHSGDAVSLSAIQENQNQLKVSFSETSRQMVETEEEKEEKELTIAAQEADTPIQQPVSVDSSKRSGICSSLLAVIEQLRERSGVDDVLDGQEVEVKTSTDEKIVLRTTPTSRSNDDNWDMNNLEKLADGHFRCKLCHYQSFQFTLIRQHMKMHKIKQPFECSLCDFIATDSSRLQDHMLRHCKIRTYQCKNCPATFPYKSQLRAHQRAHTEDPFVCEKCSFETSNPLIFRNHIKIHSQPGVSEAEIVDRRNSEEYSPSPTPRVKTLSNILSEAKGSSCPSQSNPVTEITPPEVASNEEIAVEFGQSETFFVCDACEFKSDDLEMLKEHFVSEHASKKGVKVTLVKDTSTVDVSFKKTAVKLPENAARSGNVSQAPLPRKEDAENKKKGKISQSKPPAKVIEVPENLQCNLCDFTAISVRSLKSHMKRHINDQRFVEQPLEQYKCALCGYVCHHLPSLKSHMWRHASEDKYSYHRANDVINAAIDRVATTATTVEGSNGSNDDNVDDVKSGSRGSQSIETFITFRCCQCGFESTDQATLSAHMKNHQDVIAKTLEV